MKTITVPNETAKKLDINANHFWIIYFLYSSFMKISFLRPGQRSEIQTLNVSAFIVFTVLGLRNSRTQHRRVR